VIKIFEENIKIWFMLNKMEAEWDCRKLQVYFIVTVIFIQKELTVSY